MTDSKDREKWEDWAARALAGRHLHEPGRGVMQRATDLAARWSTGLKRRLAWLIFDSSLEPLPAGVRSGPPAERRVLFGIGSKPGDEADLQLDLRVRRGPAAGERVEVTGQLLPPPTRASVRLQVGKRVRRQSLGRAGSFVIAGLPSSGVAELTVHLGEQEPIALPPIALDD